MPYKDPEKQREYSRNRDRMLRQLKTGRKAKGTEITDNPSLVSKNKGGRPSKAQEDAKLAEMEEEYSKKSANQMLNDMRWIYRAVDGRKKLKKLVQDDDKQFVIMVKELMKIEASLLTAQIRKDGEIGGVGPQNFFVVLKGLEEVSVKGVVDKTVDMKQIQEALNPNAQKYEVEADNRGDRPDELISTPKFEDS